MEKQTKILIGIGAAIALYLILKPKTAASQTTKMSEDPTIIGGGIVPNTGGSGVGIDTGGVGVLENPVGESHPPALPIEKTTKDCLQVGYDCTKNIFTTIQIPLDADCNNYQPAMPQCAQPRGNDMFMVAPMLPSDSLNFV